MLIWNKKKKQADEENACCIEICTHIEQLEAGHENHLAALYPVLLLGDETLVNIAADAIHACMSRLDAAAVIRLDGQFRQYTSMEWSIHWRKLPPESVVHHIADLHAKVSVLRLGTLHPNGR